MINSIKSEKTNLIEKNYQEIKEHLFAQVLVERSEEVGNLTIEALKSKIIDNYGLAAMAILENLLQETDLAYFNDHNDIKSLFELCNYVKLCYTDHAIRRRLVSDLSYKYFCSLLNHEDQVDIGMELLTYVADAIAFLAKNKIQFVEDFGYLFSISEAVDNDESDCGSGKYDLGKRLRNLPEGLELAAKPQSEKVLRMRDFSVALQEAAYQDLTAGSYRASIPGWKINVLNDLAREMGEKAYWDIFFWLRPGCWFRRNLQQVSVII